ncbi:MAG: Clp protease N-terminal domain-containing protein, partial [Planctomycetota bacterium]
AAPSPASKSAERVRVSMTQKLAQGAAHALACAREEAFRHNHGWLGTEHILVGLARARSGGAERVLACTGLDDVDVLRRALVAVAPPGPTRPAAGPLPISAATRAALEQAVRCATDLGRARIGTEHLLLGILRDPASPACRMVEDLRYDVGHLRGEILDILRASVGDASIGEASEVVRIVEPRGSQKPRPAAAPPLPRLTDAPLIACPRGHGPMEKLRDARDILIAVCSECLGTFIPGGKLGHVLARLANDGPLDGTFSRIV